MLPALSGLRSEPQWLAWRWLFGKSSGGVSRRAEARFHQLKDLADICLRGRKLALESIRAGDMVGSKALEALRSLLLGLEACCAGVALLYCFTKLKRQLLNPDLKFLVRCFDGLAVSFQLLYLFCRCVHRRRRELNGFQNTGNVGAWGRRCIRVGHERGRIPLRTPKVAI